MDAKPPILEFLRIVRRTSDFGGSVEYYGGRKTRGAKPPILEFLRRPIVRRTSDFGVLNINYY